MSAFIVTDVYTHMMHTHVRTQGGHPDGADNGSSLYMNGSASAGRDASPTVAPMGGAASAAEYLLMDSTPDYLFEMFFLCFVLVYLLLQNYNVHFDVS